jgi:hypothetical protein
MTPQQAPQQGGGDIFDEMGAILLQLVELAGPEWVMEFLQAGIQEAQNAGGDQGGMAPPQPMQGGGPPKPPPPIRR